MCENSRATNWLNADNVYDLCDTDQFCIRDWDDSYGFCDSCYNGELTTSARNILLTRLENDQRVTKRTDFVIGEFQQSYVDSFHTGKAREREVITASRTRRTLKIEHISPDEVMQMTFHSPEHLTARVHNVLKSCILFFWQTNFAIGVTQFKAASKARRKQWTSPRAHHYAKQNVYILGETATRLGMASGSAVQPHPQPQRKKQNRTHATAKFSTARTQPQISRPHARNRKIPDRRIAK